MRKVIYLVNGQRVTSYNKARELQPTGRLEVTLERVLSESKVSAETLAKRKAYFQKRREARKA